MVQGFSLPVRVVSHTGRCGRSISRELNLGRFRSGVNRVGTAKAEVSASVHRETDNTRVFVLSDLHTDYVENMTWVKRISSTSYLEDVLLVAGDVSETYDNFCFTMSLLTKRFKHVFYVPGNHDLWCRTETENFLDSLDKLSALLDACRELGVHSVPKMIGDLGIIPLFSWYHESFDKEQEITGLHAPPLELDLCPEKRMLFYPNLHKIIGSDFLEARIRSIHGAKGNERACHVFGHTHFGWDAIVDGIRYTQAPLAYPRERKRRMNGGEDLLPFCLFCNGNFTNRGHFYWSDYYSINSRTPDIQQLAPWVARFYRKQVS